MNIIPEDMMNTIIQPILNPNILRPLYLDKNMFNRIYGYDNMATTVLRRINGEYFNAGYRSLGSSVKTIPMYEFDGLIAKPSRDSYGGRNIMLFKKNHQEGSIDKYYWNADESVELSVELLDMHLGKDWILQEQLKQHPFTAQFNESSVNTFRIHIYRSPVTGTIHIPAICIRVGAKGNWFDNIHNGGFCVGVNVENGVLSKQTVDGNANPTKHTNGIDFENKTFVIPNFDKLIDFSKSIAEKVIHHHSLAADVMMDQNGEFKVIEVNIGTFDSEMYIATGFSPFGKLTDEVIDYCSKRKDAIKFVHVIPW